MYEIAGLGLLLSSLLEFDTEKVDEPPNDDLLNDGESVFIVNPAGEQISIKDIVVGVV